MNAEPYKVNPKTFTRYEFESVGIKGSVIKGVEITPLQIPGFYNFGFGDIREDGSIDDLTTTNNGDLVKVFSTIIRIMEDFIKANPSATIFFAGSTQQRTDIYTFMMKRNYFRFSVFSSITGILNTGETLAEVEFNPSGNEKYSGFLIRKKVINLF